MVGERGIGTLFTSARQCSSHSVGIVLVVNNLISQVRLDNYKLVAFPIVL